MHQLFLDMQCLKGGDIQEFLSSLKKWRHKLTAASVTVTKPEYKHTIIHRVPDPLSAYASQMMGSLHLTCKLTCSPFDMIDRPSLSSTPIMDEFYPSHSFFFFFFFFFLIQLYCLEHELWDIIYATELVYSVQNPTTT